MDIKLDQDEIFSIPKVNRNKPKSTPFGRPLPQEAINGVRILSEIRQNKTKRRQENKIEDKKYKDVMAEMVANLLKMGIRYVDQSENGSGPFWVLKKHTTSGMSQDKKIEMVTKIIFTITKRVKANVPTRPEEVIKFQENFVKAHCHRDFVLEPAVVAPERIDIDDLLEWQQGKDNSIDPSVI